MSASETSKPDAKPSSNDPPEFNFIGQVIPDLPSVPGPEFDAHALAAADIKEVEALIDALTGEADKEAAPAEGPIAAEKMELPSPSPPSSSQPGESTPQIAKTEPELDFEANNSEDVHMQTPAPEVVEPLSQFPPRKRGRGAAKTGLELAIVPASQDLPDWLPPGWRMESRVRSSGVTAGMRDRYFYDPVSGRQFRSKREVLCFLETGMSGRQRAKSKKKDTNADVTPLKTSEHPSSGGKRANGSTFDFLNRPAKVKWVLTDSATGSWTPFIGDEKLPESRKQEWATAFKSIALRNSGSTMFQR
ncbi:PREDICTED: uncharacterized protein LOC104602459 isoform X2 [Nelumbo nucifera]|uniref:Uncharacterized protein LOC104602459 isoform X2 n=1 Tax=Nelumbo nucifera TaxID=4432 RepID=A0A1U8AC74_NELNU|nr:PREDICTED: uncharacterized protein LOC104602459 isoform X2 [Nelumbo nucifera]